MFRAPTLYARGDLDGAMALYKEQERLCRELGTPQGLALSLANQAVLFASSRGRRRDALDLAGEAYELASSHGLTALAERIRPILDHVRTKAR